jgi:CubicO group peptidase (beta-lactamase class C family)
MRHLRISISSIIAIALLFYGRKIVNSSLCVGQAGRIDSLMNAVYRRGQFTGAILVASHGRIIYEKAFGFADRERQRPFTLDTREYIGSISKQMTAMGIMILHDRGKLRYDQPVKDFFPELPLCMQPVTIRDLLYHTSGLALFDDFPNMTEQDVFRILLAQKELRFPPGKKFEYCNAGYSLLGMIIEKVSGQTLNGFLQANLFARLGMRHTLLTENGHRDTARAIGYTLFGAIDNYDTYMGGNASVVSTVGDLYLWDQGIAQDRLVSRKTQKEALTPSSKVTGNRALVLKDPMFGDKSYGFGLWLADRDGGLDSWHDGAFSGYAAYNERVTAGRTVIAEVSNLRGAALYEIRQAIVDILGGRPYKLPKLSAAVWLDNTIKTAGVDSAVSAYRQLYRSADPDYEFSEAAINSYAYILLRTGRVREAIKVFQLNAGLYPNSFNVYDSLADGYEKAGDKAAALATCKKALAVDPTNTYMKQRIASLEKNQPQGH